MEKTTMCNLDNAFKNMIETTPGITYPKLATMLCEANHKKLQALFDPDREDRPFQMKHMIPSMEACKDITPLKLMNAHFGLSTFKFDQKDTSLNAQSVLDLLVGATGVGNAISKAIDPKSPGGRQLTREENQACLDEALVAMSALMGIIKNLQDCK